MSRRSGIASVLSASSLWGILPLYWKYLSEVLPLEIILHRIIWSAVLLVIFVAASGRMSAFRKNICDPKTVGMFFITGVLIGGNWLLYIYAVVTNQTSEACLGYYICPLLSVVLGAFGLKETVKPLQWVAFSLAAIGVGIRIQQVGTVPWIGIVLALSFGFYGLLRKRMNADSITGLAIETVILFPLAAGMMVYLGLHGQVHFFSEPIISKLLLLSAGLVTALPLALYGYGITQIPYSFMGFLQFFGPSIQLVIAFLVFKEPVTAAAFWSFAVILAGVGLFIFDSLRRVT